MAAFDEMGPKNRRWLYCLLAGYGLFTAMMVATLLSY